jgi:hypothetical protein
VSRAAPNAWAPHPGVPPAQKRLSRPAGAFLVLKTTTTPHTTITTPKTLTGTDRKALAAWHQRGHDEARHDHAQRQQPNQED